MDDIEPTLDNGQRMTVAMFDAINNHRLDEAEIWLERLRDLNQMSADHPDILAFRSLIAIQRGQATEALCHMNGLDDDHAPDVKVMCMFFAGDPLWEGLAADLAERSPDPTIRETMATLLGRQPAA